MLRCTLLAQRGLRVATRLPRVRFAAPVRLRLLSSAFEAAPSAAASSELAEAADAAVLSKVAVVVATPPEEPAAAAAAEEPPAAAAADAEPPRQWPEGVAPSAGTTVAVVSPLFLKKRLVGYTLTPTDGSEAMLLFSRRQGHLIPNAEGRVGLCHGEHVEVTCEEKEHDGKMVREVTSVAGPHGGAVQGVPPKPRTPKSTDANAPRAWPDGVEPSAGASVAVVRPLILNKRHVGAVLKPLDGSADALLFFQKHKKLIPNAPGTQGLRYGEHVEVTSIEKEYKGKMVREVTSVAGPHGGPVQGTPTKPKSELKKAEASTAVPVAAAPAQTFDEYMAKNAGPIPPGVEEVEVHAVDAKGVAQVTGRHCHYHRLRRCHRHLTTSTAITAHSSSTIPSLVQVPISERVMYDDFNELFWDVERVKKLLPLSGTPEQREHGGRRTAHASRSPLAPLPPLQARPSSARRARTSTFASCCARRRSARAARPSRSASTSARRTARRAAGSTRTPQ